MRIVFFLICFLPALYANAQDSLQTKTSGRFMLGVRSTASLFSDGSGLGIGVGGQFRLQASKRVNTEWFSDYLSSAVSDLGYRKDAHIGWSVLFYMTKTPFKPRTFSPYILGGHCFDYTRITDAGNGEYLERWSSAIQAGLGTHYNLTKSADITFSGQYMVHLGTDIHADVHTEIDGERVLHMEKVNSGVSLEGHLLLTMSLNVKVANLWKPKS